MLWQEASNKTNKVMKRKTDKSREEAIEYKKTYYGWMAWTSVLIVQLRSCPSLLQTDLWECHTRNWKNPELQKVKGQATTSFQMARTVFSSWSSHVDSSNSHHQKGISIILGLPQQPPRHTQSPCNSNLWKIIQWCLRDTSSWKK